MVKAVPELRLVAPVSYAATASPYSIVYDEMPACGLPSWIASPFCSLSMCGSHIVPDFTDFSPMAEPNGMTSMVSPFHLMLNPVMTRLFAGEGMFLKFLVEILVLPLYVNKPGYFKHSHTSLLLNLLHYTLL